MSKYFSGNVKACITALSLGALLLLAAGAQVVSAGGPKDTISIKELTLTLDSGAEVAIVDVRTPEEFEYGHIPGSISIPLETIVDGSEISSAGTVVLYSASGERSREALNMLLGKGKTGLMELEGGLEAWLKAQGNLVAGPDRAMSGYPASYLIPMGVCETKEPLRRIGK